MSVSFLNLFFQKTYSKKWFNWSFSILFRTTIHSQEKKLFVETLCRLERGGIYKGWCLPPSESFPPDSCEAAESPSWPLILCHEAFRDGGDRDIVREESDRVRDANLRKPKISRTGARRGHKGHRAEAEAAESRPQGAENESFEKFHREHKRAALQWPTLRDVNEY